MATEKYGVDGQIVQSIGSTPVSTETNIIFIGASPSGALNKPVLITSLVDYNTKLGGAPGDGYNLTEAAIAAFSIAGIDKCYMIPVSNSLTFSAADYIGSASLETGVYAIDALLRDNPTAVNLLCAPSITDSTVISALNAVAKKADGHWQSYMLYDVTQSNDQINENNILQPAAVVSAKQLNEEHAGAVWGSIKTSGGYIISGAAVRACLMALSDSNYSVPARCGGNLAVPAIQSVVNTKASDEVTSTCTLDNDKPKFTITQSGYSAYNGVAICSYTYTGTNITDTETETQEVTFTNGVGVMDFDTSAITGFAQDSYSVRIPALKNVTIREADATQLSADGICTFLNVGGGNWRTWGDHTSAFSSGTVADERARFDNNIRMLMMITNRFQLKYRFSIDDPMTLQMRNDVITEQLDYLSGLVAIGALIGQPIVEFVAADNTTDQIAQGQFTWSIQCTSTIPAKYLNVKVAYSQAGLSVYTTE